MKHKLVFDYDFGFLLFGISCHDASYRLCWFMNRALGLKMALMKDHLVPQKKGSSQHLHYCHDQGEEKARFTLLGNHSNEGVLVPELKQFDFLLKVEEGEAESVEADKVISEVREIPTVIACYPLDATKLKHKDNLILE